MIIPRQSARTCAIMSAMKAKEETLYQRASKIVSCHNSRAKKLEVLGRLTVRDWINCLKRAKGKCPACKKFVGWWAFELDHIVALAAGGTNHPENIRAICQPCNSRKKDGPLELAHSDKYCTTSEARKIIGCTSVTVLKMVRRGRIKGVISRGASFLLRESVIEEGAKWREEVRFDEWPDYTAERR